MTIKTISIDPTKTIFVSAHSWRVGAPDSTWGESWDLDLVHTKVRTPERRAEILALAAECKAADAEQDAAEERAIIESAERDKWHRDGQRRVVNAGLGRCR